MGVFELINKVTSMLNSRFLSLSSVAVNRLLFLNLASSYQMHIIQMY